MADSTAIKFYNPIEKFRPLSAASPSTSGRINGETLFDSDLADIVYFDGSAFKSPKALASTAETNAKSYADGLVVGLWDDRGDFDASGGGYPTTSDGSGGSGAASAIMKGDTWRISTAGTAGEVGTVLRALTDDPGQTASNWGKAAGTDVLDSTFSAGAGTVAIGDSYQEAIEKLDGNIAGKEATLTKGNLTETTSNVLTITGGTDAIIGSGLTIEVDQVDTDNDGYLSSTDWDTFNNKAPGSLSSYTKGAGTVADADTVQEAIQKLDGNLDTKQDLYEDATVEAGDWSGTGPYTLTVAAATHGFSTLISGFFWETSGSDEIFRPAVYCKKNTSGDIILESDTALAGRLVINGI